MKRTIASLAVLAVLATGAFAQTSDPYNHNATTKTSTPSSSTTNADMIDNNAKTTNELSSTENATTTTDNDTNNLPATASPLPLLALNGLGMIATGAWLVRRRRHA